MSWMGRIIGSLALAGILVLPAVAQPSLTADQAVQMALEHNSQIINASAGIYDARGSLYRAYSGVMPSLSADLSRSGSWNENKPGTQAFASFLSESPLRSRGYQTSPSISGMWNVLNLSALSSLSSARAGMQSARWRLSATRSDVVLAARQQFYEVVKAVRLADVADAAVRLARDGERRVRALFEVGSVSRSDVLRAQVNTSQAVLDSIVAVQSVLVQRGNLAGLIGVEEARMGQVDTLLIVTPRAYDEAALLSEAEANRPDLKAAAAAVRSAKASALAARLQRLPYLSVSASATFNPTSSSTITRRDTLGNEVDYSSRSEAKRQVGARLSLSWDFFNGLNIDASNASARAGLLRAQDGYDVLRRNLASEVHEAFMTYQQMLAGENVARIAVESALENVKLIQQKYNVGSATILELIDAQVQLQRAQSQEVSALAAIRVVEAQIERVRGIKE